MNLYLEGLSGLQNSIITNWIGPIFIVGLAIAGLMLLKNKSTREAIALLGLAIIIALFIYAGPVFFGENGIFTNTAKTELQKVKTN